MDSSFAAYGRLCGCKLKLTFRRFRRISSFTGMSICVVTGESFSGRELCLDDHLERPCLGGIRESLVRLNDVTKLETVGNQQFRVKLVGA